MDKEIQLTEGDFVLDDARFAIVCSRCNPLIVSQLEKSAIDTLKRHGTDLANIEVFKAPGVFELPLVAKQVAETRRFEAIIVLGAVIRDTTASVENISNQCAADISKVSLETNLPIAFGVLTAETIEQSIEHAESKAGNKGYEAALTVIEMVSLLRQIN